MPINTNTIGLCGNVSPIETKLTKTWIINFAAGSIPYLNNHNFIGDGSNDPNLNVIPVFLSSCIEVIGAWSCLYKTGLSKKEVIKTTFVHYKFDAEFFDILTLSDEINSECKLVGIGLRENKKNVEFITKFTHTNPNNNKLFCKSWWHGVVLTKEIEGENKYLENELPKERYKIKKNDKIINKINFIIKSNQAHIHDSVVRNPRIPKKKSSDINTHTDLYYAKSAGLQTRNLNGLVILNFSIFHILEYYNINYNGKTIKRIGCDFIASSFIDLDDINYTINIIKINNNNEIIFNVLDLNINKIVLNNGLLIINDKIINSKI